MEAYDQWGVLRALRIQRTIFGYHSYRHVQGAVGLGRHRMYFFVWLAIQNIIGTSDCLAKRGWPNYAPCPSAKGARNHRASLLQMSFHAETLRVGKDWLHLVSVDILIWATFRSIKEWRVNMASTQRVRRRAMPSLTMLVNKANWDERNARIF